MQEDGRGKDYDCILGVSGGVDLWLGGVGHGPGAVRLEEQLVLSPLEAEPSALAPVLAPRVAHDPEPAT